jgi:hypothetical protein
MDQETKKTTDDLYIRNFEVLCLQVVLSSRVNALKEMFHFLLEAADVKVHPTTSYEQVSARIEAEQLEAILRGYADEDPNLASAIEERLKKGA